jgi:hypothetical protein
LFPIYEHPAYILILDGLVSEAEGYVLRGIPWRRDHKDEGIPTAEGLVFILIVADQEF